VVRFFNEVFWSFFGKVNLDCSVGFGALLQSFFVLADTLSRT